MPVHWPKFQNIHRLIAEGEVDAEKPFLACEKLDGSNLGIEISSSSSPLVAIHGRTRPLWEQGDKSSLWDRTYGNVKGTLHPISNLVPKLQRLAKRVLQNEPTALTNNVVFYGEWFRGPDQDEASWHPFGYAFKCRKELGECHCFRTMTPKLHALFREHGLDPPKILFSGGTLYELIDSLFSQMMEAVPAFEGVFITSEEGGGTRNCAKWKTGYYEEQSSFVIPREMEHPERMTQAIEQLRLVFESKQNTGETKVRVAKAKKKKVLAPQTEEEEAIDRQIRLALHSVLSKSPNSAEEIRGMERSDFTNEMKRLVAETFEDVSETYTASGMAVPKDAKKRVGKVVSDHVMKGKPLLAGGDMKEEKKDGN